MASFRQIIGAFQSLSFIAAMLMCCTAWASPGFAQDSAHQKPFHFEALTSLDDMRQFIMNTFPLGSSRDSLRKAFVEEGHATLKSHPTQEGVEKYIYDINLCSYYVWRWNISVDYDSEGRSLQAYLNGMPVFPEGEPKRVTEAKTHPGQKASIIKASRSRPEAMKGESSLAYLLLDRDSDLKTIDDQSLIGAGPSRADPVNMGALITYKDVEPWRSIFDPDAADSIAPYPGECSKQNR